MSNSSAKSKSKPLIKEHSPNYLIEERYELINGIRYDLSPSPKYVHQKILMNLHFHMRTSCMQDGEILLAPMDVHFDEANIAQPDLIYISGGNRSILRDGWVYGAPDLCVEVLSRSTGRKDKTVKKAMFEKFGVKEYWVFEPTYQTVDQFVLTDGRYQLFATLDVSDTLTSPLIACISLNLNEIFPPEAETE